MLNGVFGELRGDGWVDGVEGFFSFIEEEYEER